MTSSSSSFNANQFSWLYRADLLGASDKFSLINSEQIENDRYWWWLGINSVNRMLHVNEDINHFLSDVNVARQTSATYHNTYRWCDASVVVCGKTNGNKNNNNENAADRSKTRVECGHEPILRLSRLMIWREGRMLMKRQRMTGNLSGRKWAWRSVTMP